LPPQLRHQNGFVSFDSGASRAGGRIGGRATWQMFVPKTLAAPALTIVLNRVKPALRAPDLLPGERRDLGFRLLTIKLLSIPRTILPPAKRAMTEWRFGWNELTEDCLVDGWGEPEDGFVWAVGRTSTLRLPIEPVRDPKPALLLLDMRPAGYPHDFARQRIAVSVDERPAVYIDLKERMSLALPMQPLAGASSISCRFDHFDAVGTLHTVLHDSGKPFAWALASARLMPRPPALAPDALSPLLHSPSNGFEDGSLELAIKRRTEHSMAQVASRFEGLGHGCWLGILQRRLGMMPTALLAYAAIHQFRLVDGILAGFADLGRPDQKLWAVRAEEDTTWRLIDLVFDLSIATPYPRSIPPPADGFAKASVALPWLARKLLADIAAGEKIFVINPMGAQCEAAALAVLAALRHFGDAQLLWVAEDGSGPVGSVVRLPSGLLKGHKDSTEESMMSVLTNAYAFVYP
jgi:hypothetical protein